MVLFWLRLRSQGYIFSKFWPFWPNSSIFSIKWQNLSQIWPISCKIASKVVSLVIFPIVKGLILTLDTPPPPLGFRIVGSFEIWQAAHAACQISKACNDSNYQSRDFTRSHNKMSDIETGQPRTLPFETGLGLALLMLLRARVSKVGKLGLGCMNQQIVKTQLSQPLL